MKVFMILFVYFGITKCSRLLHSKLTYDIPFEDALEWFPWMVVITNNETNFYGSIIHERAVLTLAVFEIGKLYSDFRVIYDYYIFDDYPRFTNLPNRRIQEYNIIETEKTEYQKNLAILLVDEPFPPTSTLNPNPRVIPLVEDLNEIDFSKCITLSVRTFEVDSTSFVSILYEIKGRFNEHGTFFLTTTHGNNTIYDDQGRQEQLVFGENSNEPMINIIGGPVVCRINERPRHFVQVSVLNLSVVTTDHSLFLQDSSVRFLINIPLKNIVEKIIYRARVA